jgi:hypothetical protein
MTRTQDYAYRGYTIAVRVLLEGWGVHVVGLQGCHSEGHPSAEAALEAARACIDSRLAEKG